MKRRDFLKFIPLIPIALMFAKPPAKGRQVVEQIETIAQLCSKEELEVIRQWTGQRVQEDKLHRQQLREQLAQVTGLGE